MTSEAISVPAAAPARAPSSLWRDTLRHLLHQRTAVVGLVILSTLPVVAVIGYCRRMRGSSSA